jgi:hypothetical protein
MSNPDLIMYPNIFNIIVEKGQTMPLVYDTVLNPYRIHGSGRRLLRHGGLSGAQILLQSRQGHWPGTPQYRVLHPMAGAGAAMS